MLHGKNIYSLTQAQVTHLLFQAVFKKPKADITFVNELSLFIQCEFCAVEILSLNVMND